VEVNNLANQLNASQARCAQLEQANVALTDQVAHLNAAVADLTAQLNDCRLEVNNLAASVAHLQA
jgi:chromosome segregation ATPase